jgi:hypothetical protein
VHTQVLKAAQGKVFEANCIFAGVCAPQVFVYSPGMYSSSNKDFVRGTVSSFYEMFKQVCLQFNYSYTLFGAQCPPFYETLKQLCIAIVCQRHIVLPSTRLSNSCALL